MKKYLIIISLIFLCFFGADFATTTINCGQSNILCVDDTPGITQEYSTIQAAVNAASGPGDTIYIFAGTYIENLDFDKKADGTQDNPIIITPYGFDSVTISPSNNNYPTIWFHDTSSWWKIDGKNQLTIIGANNAGSVGMCIEIYEGNVGITIKDTILNGTLSSRSLIRLLDEGHLFEGNVFQGSYYKGIEGSGASPPLYGSYRVTVRDNTFIDPGYAGVEASGASYWLIERNYFYRLNSGGQFFIQHRGGSNWIIKHNIFEVRDGAGISAFIYERDDTAYSGYDIQNDAIMNNHFILGGNGISNSYGAIFHSGTIKNNKYQNNLFIGADNISSGFFQCSGSSCSSGSTGNIISHNLKEDSDPWNGTNLTPGFTLSDNGTGTINYKGSGNKPSPYFTLLFTSPAIDAGVNLGNAYKMALDPDDTSWPISTLDQNNHGSGWEIGAFVYRPPDTTPPSPPTGVMVI